MTYLLRKMHNSGQSDFWNKIDMIKDKGTCIEPRFPRLRRLLTLPWRILMFFPRLPHRLKVLEEKVWVNQQMLDTLEKRVYVLENKSKSF